MPKRIVARGKIDARTRALVGNAPDKRIVYTRHDGGVSVCAPSMTAMAYMTGGGGRWDAELIHLPRGFLERQIEGQAKHGVGEWAAARFVRAMQFGGLTTAEAYAVMRDRFCAHLGTGCELWDVADVPTDRRHRDAWRRSHNGGPILIDERKAMEIDEVRAWEAYEASLHRLPPVVLVGGRVR